MLYMYFKLISICAIKKKVNTYHGGCWIFENGQRKLLSTIFLNTGSLTWESQRFTTAPPAIWEHSLVSAPKMTRCRAWLNINHFRRLALSNIFSMMTELWRSLNKAQQSVVLYMMRTLWVLWLFECVFSVLY